MSIVRKLPPEEREVPHEPGCFMSFRPLAGTEIEEAQAANLRELGERFPPEVLRSIRDLAQPDQAGEVSEARQRAERDPLAGYSQRVLLRFGLTDWRGPSYDGELCSDENKDGLDTTTRRWAALQALEVSRINQGEVVSSAPGSDGSGSERVRLRAISESGSPS